MSIANRIVKNVVLMRTLLAYLRHPASLNEEPAGAPPRAAPELDPYVRAACSSPTIGVRWDPDGSPPSPEDWARHVLRHAEALRVADRGRLEAEHFGVGAEEPRRDRPSPEQVLEALARSPSGAAALRRSVAALRAACLKSTADKLEHRLIGPTEALSRVNAWHLSEKPQAADVACRTELETAARLEGEMARKLAGEDVEPAEEPFR